ncbi:MAG: 2,3-bisphosphoglycerate-dependent phosphoglycerate mutase [Anaerolineales bacterium]|nr:2,3-bisphosphoglycerate-dependent phosphoglycerate mutase [Anaerolineales bacterium]
MTDAQYSVTFLRHGESTGNAENRFQGQADFPLTEQGRQQARALADQWRSERVAFDQCFTSPLLRAKETAEIVCTALNIPVEVDPAWMEMDNGRMAGLRDDEMDWDEPKFMTPYTRFGETGESRLEIYLRAGRAIQSILDRKAGRYLVVSHGGILTMTMYSILSIAPQAHHNGPRFWFRNTTYADFAYDPQWHNWRLLRFDRSHWK